MLRRIVSVATDRQTSCGLQITTKAVHRELHGMSFLRQVWLEEPLLEECSHTLLNRLSV